MRTIVWLLLANLIATGAALADPPELQSWTRNTDGHTGYNSILADVQAIYYSADFVYVESTGIPSYTIGPWPMNPNTAGNQSFRFKIARHPVAATTHTATPLGQIGVWRNGVAIFNPLDAMSYQNRNIWHQNAVTVEGPSMDACLGHPNMTSTYHHHQNPTCMYSTADTTLHSAILGYAFDGFPVYGPYAFANTDGSGGTRRMRTSYQKRNITQRTTLPDGTPLTPIQYGPAISTTYPLGYYVEDYEYIAGLGDLDEYNGRVTVTPDYLLGTYAYFVTIDQNGATAYPYIIGPRYYGVLVAGNTGMGGGHVVIGEPVTPYTGPTTGLDSGALKSEMLALSPAHPNPATSRSMVRLTLARESEIDMAILDVGGRRVRSVAHQSFAAGEHPVPIELAGLAPGLYLVQARSASTTGRTRIIVVR